ncbi:PREDICTED: uncharacterized protein LOC106553407 [Thamnophis sirtalis]|uniref:Uncharacterized protein LOC106553407 n=1 Tax=Thamnophis sirtalis TaxID=35019 RepID=A0A6I9YSU3_9SAUR|nr:PREDICTED: uncharacterized protein LOC106553407 [Thamnophis sirtalis]
MNNTVKEEIYNALNELIEQQFKEFKWRLNSIDYNGRPNISTASLEKTEAQDVVDLLIQHYGKDALEVCIIVLRKCNRNDLAEKLEETGQKVADVDAHQLPDSSGKTGIIQRVIELCLKLIQHEHFLSSPSPSTQTSKVDVKKEQEQQLDVENYKLTVSILQMLDNGNNLTVPLEYKLGIIFYYYDDSQLFRLGNCLDVVTDIIEEHYYYRSSHNQPDVQTGFGIFVYLLKSYQGPAIGRCECLMVLLILSQDGSCSQ